MQSCNPKAAVTISQNGADQIAAQTIGFSINGEAPVFAARQTPPGANPETPLAIGKNGSYKVVGKPVCRSKQRDRAVANQVEPVRCPNQQSAVLALCESKNDIARETIARSEA
jgi:hypothetical protein